MITLFLRPKIRKTRPALAHSQEVKQEKPHLPNSCVMRILEESGAEREAERLSAGITSTTPDELREEMGSRLGADFSAVRFHDDTASIGRSRSLGARAWAQDSDVYFGRGGFDPAIAAHELVHTVQQGAVSGNVSQTMPLGAVQRYPYDEDDLNQINTDNNQKKKGGVDPLEGTILGRLNTQFGIRCYQDFERPLKDMIKKGAGKTVPAYTKESGIHFMVEGANRIYTAKPILEQIAQNSLESKDDAKQRAKEYKGFIQFLSGKLGDFGLEEIAVENDLINRVPKYDHNRSTKDTRSKRAWELENHSKDKDEKTLFNPTHDPELEKIQQQIDTARDAMSAYRIFAAFTGNSKGSLKDSYSTIKGLDVSLLKKKLKHMARVVIDYPELRNSIGNMKTLSKTEKLLDPQTKKTVTRNNQTIMATEGTLGNRNKATLYYNAWMDRAGTQGENERADMDFDARWHNKLNAHRDYAGTHELGHVMASTLQNSEDEMEAIVENKFGIVENKMLQSAVNEGYRKNIMKWDEMTALDLKKKQHRTAKREINILDPKAAKMHKAGHTSAYGAQNPSEFFAEAVSDVYAHGKDAKPMSIEIVKEYEKRKMQQEKDRFFAEQNKKAPSLMQKLFGWLKFW